MSGKACVDMGILVCVSVCNNSGIVQSRCHGIPLAQVGVGSVEKRQLSSARCVTRGVIFELSPLQQQWNSTCSKIHGTVSVLTWAMIKSNQTLRENDDMR